MRYLTLLLLLNITLIGHQVHAQNWQEIAGMDNNPGNGYGRLNCIAIHPSKPNTIFAGAWVGGVWKTTDGGNNWQVTDSDNDLHTLATTDLEVDPSNGNYVYVATGDRDNNKMHSEGIYRSTDEGINWEPINGGLPLENKIFINHILVHDNGHKAFLATSKGLYKTSDIRASSPQWNKINSSAFLNSNIPNGHESFHSLTYKPTGNTSDPFDESTIYAGGKLLYRSQDGGNTWHKIVNHNGSGSTYNGINISYGNSGECSLYDENLEELRNDISNSGNICDETGGCDDCWVNFNRSRFLVDISPADPNKVYAYLITMHSAAHTANNPDATYLYELNLNNQNPSWSLKVDFHTTSDYNIPYPPPHISDLGFSAFEVDHNNANRVYFGGSQLIVYNDGNVVHESYNVDNRHVDFHEMVMNPYISSDDNLYVGSDGKLDIYNTDTSLSLTNEDRWYHVPNKGLNIATIYGISSSVFETDVMAIGTQDCGSSLYKNGEWDHKLGGDGYHNYFHETIKHLAYMTNNSNDIHYLDHSGSNDAKDVDEHDWNDNDIGSTAGGPSAHAEFKTDPVNKDIFYHTRDHLYKIKVNKSSPYTKTSTKFKQLTDFENLYSIGEYQKVRAYAIAPTDNNTIYAALLGNAPNQSRLFVSYNGGGVNQGDWQEIDLQPIKNEFNNWSDDYINGEEEIDIKSMTISNTDKDHIWITVAGDARGQYLTPKIQVWESQDGGNTWAAYNQGLPDINVLDIVCEKGSNDNLYLGTNKGVYYRNGGENTNNTTWNPFMDRTNDNVNRATTDGLPQNGSLPNVLVWNMEINYSINKIRSGTFGRGVWESNLKCPPDAPVSITNSITQNRYEETQSSIAASSQINSDLIVNFRAGNEVDLEQGFEYKATQQESFFNGFIHGCGNSNNEGSSFRLAGNTSVLPSNAAINESENGNGFNVYPNPSDGELNISLINNSDNLVDLTVYDTDGNNVLNKRNIKKKSFKINLSEYSNQFLMIGIKIGKEIHTKKVFIQ